MSRRLSLLLLLVVSLALRAPFFVEPPGRDQSVFLTDASLLLDGRALYLDVWEHKPPGVIFAYALGLALFGKSYLAIHVLAWLSAFAASVGIWLLVERATGRTAPALLAASLYVWLEAGVAFSGFWSTAQAESFMDPLVVWALVWLLPDDGPTARRSVLAGAALGGVFLLKYSALPVLVVPAVLVAARKSTTADRARALAWLALGVVLALVPVGIYLVHKGAAGAFWDATATFNLEHQRISTMPRTEHLGDHLLYKGWRLAPLYAFAAFGWLLAAARTSRQEGFSKRTLVTDGCVRLLGIGTALWAASLAGVFWQAKFWPYHFEVVVVPLCLVAGAGLSEVAALLERATSPARAALSCALGVALALVPNLLDTSAYVARHRLARYLAGHIGRDELFATYRWGDTDYDFADTARAAARAKDETGPGDSVFVWGFEPGVYFFSGRRPASRFLYDYPLMPDLGSVHERYVALLMSDLARDPPRLFLVVRRDANAIEREDSATQLAHLGPLARYLADHYAPAGEAGDFAFFRRRE